MLFISHQVYDIFAMSAQTDEDRHWTGCENQKKNLGGSIWPWRWTLGSFQKTEVGTRGFLGGTNQGDCAGTEWLWKVSAQKSLIGLKHLCEHWMEKYSFFLIKCLWRHDNCNFSVLKSLCAVKLNLSDSIPLQQWPVSVPRSRPHYYKVLSTGPWSVLSACIVCTCPSGGLHVRHAPVTSYCHPSSHLPLQGKFS